MLFWSHVIHLEITYGPTHAARTRKALQLRYSQAARNRADRGLRTLRLLPPRLPHLRALGRGDGFAARPYLHDEEVSPGRGSARPALPPAYGQLSGLHGLHDRLPLRGAIQQADRRHARPGRTEYPAHHRG